MRDLRSVGATLASPNSASVIFNPDGKHPIRQKHLFVVRFMRETQSDDSEWREGMTFVMKAMDRPSIQPETEELNQYNKTRLIHTGVKYNPINCTLYDTADGAAMNMWNQYARYYFRDYSQLPGAFNDDILSPINDSTVDKAGFGFGIRPSSTSYVDSIGSQHFFTKLEVYQVWGNEYTSYELINPRINSFNPDDLDYTNSEVSTIGMSLSYEAVYHLGNGKPQDLFSSETLTTLFNEEYSGQRLEVIGLPKTNNFTGTNYNPFAGLFGEGKPGIQQISDVIGLLRTTSSSIGGVLSRFGTYDFGSGAVTTQTIDYGISSIGGSSPLSNIVSGNFSGDVSATTTSTSKTTDTVYSAVGNAIGIPGVGEGVKLAAELLGTSSVDQATKKNGLALSAQAVAEINKPKDGTFLVGFKNII